MAYIHILPDGTKVLQAYADYLRNALTRLDLVVDAARPYFDNSPDVDTIVGRGLSGALVVPHIARELGLHWAIVRKQGDGSHSHEMFEGTIGKAWVFVDDLISSGKTLIATVEVVNEECRRNGHATRMVGAYTYAPTFWWPIEALPFPCASLQYEVQVEPDPEPIRWPTRGELMAEQLAFEKSISRELLSIAASLPSVNDLYADSGTGKSAGYTPTKPPGRGGKARRRVDKLAQLRQMANDRKLANEKRIAAGIALIASVPFTNSLSKESLS